MDSKLILMLIGMSVILCLVILHALFIYFIIDSPYKAETPVTTKTTTTTTTYTLSFNGTTEDYYILEYDQEDLDGVVTFPTEV